MKLYIDDSDTDKEFFISTPLNTEGTRVLSFDWTSKGHRILEQQYIGKGEVERGREPDGEWDTLEIIDGRFGGVEHVKWYDN